LDTSTATVDLQQLRAQQQQQQQKQEEEEARIQQEKQKQLLQLQQREREAAERRKALEQQEEAQKQSQPPLPPPPPQQPADVAKPAVTAVPSSNFRAEADPSTKFGFDLSPASSFAGSPMQSMELSGADDIKPAAASAQTHSHTPPRGAASGSKPETPSRLTAATLASSLKQVSRPPQPDVASSLSLKNSQPIWRLPGLHSSLSDPIPPLSPRAKPATTATTTTTAAQRPPLPSPQLQHKPAAAASQPQTSVASQSGSTSDAEYVLMCISLACS
jgi:hypothetical protein